MIPQYSNQYAQQQNQFIQQMLGQNMSQVQEHIIRVNGKPGADAYNLPPNSDALLLDNTASIVWFAQTDGAGYKVLVPYDLSPHKEPDQKDELEDIKTRLDRLEEKLNGESNTTNAKPRKSEHNVTSICSDDER